MLLSKVLLVVLIDTDTFHFHYNDFKHTFIYTMFFMLSINLPSFKSTVLYLIYLETFKEVHVL